MKLIKTNKDTLSNDDILKYIDDYERDVVPELDKLWKYYKAKDVAILERPTPDPNNPDNKTPIPYGRKIVKTFSGYAYRPGYITYKPIKKLSSDDDYILNYDIETNPDQIPEDILNEKIIRAQTALIESQKIDTFWNELERTFKENNEKVKTSRAGRNTGIFGLAYELLYIDGDLTMDKTLPLKAKVKFFPVDPREMILIYDYSSEPKKKIAIRFYEVEAKKYRVEVYYPDKVEVFERTPNEDYDKAVKIGALLDSKLVLKWKLTLMPDNSFTNFFGEVPVVAYYFGDEMLGLIAPVLPLIDDYDTLVSDSMNEFDRFAHAYLVMKKFGLTNPVEKKSPEKMSFALKFLKRFRVFENLPEGADVSFLTKSIPTGFVDFMSKFLQNQIHVQSHVPDFAGEKFSGASGIAIQRLLFDFENVCSDAEADFDIGLYERIRLITNIYKKLGITVANPGDIAISHKRNLPLNLQEFASTAQSMKGAGFSRYLIADIMPDDIIPDVGEELRRQDKDQEALMPDVSNYPTPVQIFDDGNGGFVDQNGNPIDQNGNPLPPQP